MTDCKAGGHRECTLGSQREYPLGAAVQTRINVFSSISLGVHVGSVTKENDFCGKVTNDEAAGSREYTLGAKGRTF